MGKDVGCWRTLSSHSLSRIPPWLQLVHKGLSSHVGKAYLYEGDDFSSNQGSASLEAPPIVVRQHEIELTTLDAFLPEDTTIGLAKLDVEGHERDVLQGAAKLLHTGRLRDLIFEDHQLHQPGHVTKMLEAAGYSVFALYAPWHKPCLIPYQDVIQNVPKGSFSDNYLATLDVERVRARFRQSGRVAVPPPAGQRIGNSKALLRRQLGSVPPSAPSATRQRPRRAHGSSRTLGAAAPPVCPSARRRLEGACQRASLSAKTALMGR